MDSPGIRLETDTAAARLTLAELQNTDRVGLVLRGTHAAAQARELLRRLPLAGKRAAIIATHGDRLAPAQAGSIRTLASCLGLPVAVLNARLPSAKELQELAGALKHASPINSKTLLRAVAWPATDRHTTPHIPQLPPLLAAAAHSFFTQAMPLFLLICLAAASLDILGLLTQLTAAAAPSLHLLGLPPTDRTRLGLFHPQKRRHPSAQ